MHSKHSCCQKKSSQTKEPFGGILYCCRLKEKSILDRGTGQYSPEPAVSSRNSALSVYSATYNEQTIQDPNILQHGERYILFVPHPYKKKIYTHNITYYTYLQNLLHSYPNQTLQFLNVQKNLEGEINSWSLCCMRVQPGESEVQA